MRNVGRQVSAELLPRVRRPGQYIGCEINARWPGGWRSEDLQAVAVVLAFPDTYSIGMSHLGSQVLYHMLNDTPGVGCDRAYCPLPDAEAVMRERRIPLFGWESRCAVGDFDILGFSLPYELCVSNVLTMLDLAGVPLHAADRTAKDPIVVGGDALADSPEPLADTFDLFLVGDGEEPLAQLAQIVRRAKANGKSGTPPHFPEGNRVASLISASLISARSPDRLDQVLDQPDHSFERPGPINEAGGPGTDYREAILLEAARTIPSAYVPRFYRPRYEGGAFAGLLRLRDDVPEQIVRARLADLADSPGLSRPLVPLSEAVHDRVTIEVMRGCPNACRFCQAGATRLPVRPRGVEEIVSIAASAIEATGYHEVSLLSLSTSDYPDLEGLISRLSAELTPRKVSISLPSLRVDSQLQLLPRLTSEVRKGGLTIAAEAGTQRLREALRKDIREEDMISAVRSAYAAGWGHVKVYFLAGVPGETPEDIDAIFHLCLRLSRARRDVDGQSGAISASVSWLVPKPHTPMQWCAMPDAEYFLGVRRRLMDMSKRSPVRFKFHRVERSLLEAFIARGDRRVGGVIEAAWRGGARLDAWDENFDYDKWTAAIAACGLDMAALVHREIPTEAPLPWSHIRAPRGERCLLLEYQPRREAAHGGQASG
jgi:radical SAM superfamily enzyme YgiQ (UPF0313 family)